jgi:hypothetical protein
MVTFSLVGWYEHYEDPALNCESAILTDLFRKFNKSTSVATEAYLWNCGTQ